MSKRGNEPAYLQGIDQGASDAGFPIVEHRGGMTILERFTMAAMQGIMASDSSDEFEDEAVAEQAVGIAIATLRELEKYELERHGAGGG